MRADRSFRRALAALPLLLGLVGSATACSVFTLDCKKLDGGVVSARTMDFMRHAEVGRSLALLLLRHQHMPRRHGDCPWGGGGRRRSP